MSGDHNQFQKPKSYLDDMNEVRKVLEMALIALEDANDMFSNDCSVEDVYADEIEALTKVLEKESFECPRCGHCCYVDDDDTSQERVDETAKQEHEPVVWASSLDFDDDDIEIIPAKAKGKLGTSNCNIPLYTAPQKREWVGLTEKEWYAATGIPRNAQLPMPMLKGIEKALKEKNG